MQKNEKHKFTLKKGASIEANANIVCGNTLGNYCFTGAGAGVVDDVPDYSNIIGNAGRQKGWMSRHGQYKVSYHKSYSVVEFDQNFNIISIEKKP